MFHITPGKQFLESSVIVSLAWPEIGLMMVLVREPPLPMKQVYTPRERAFCIVLGSLLMILTLWIAVLLRTRSTLMHQNERLLATLEQVAAELEAKAGELAPFASLAERQFPDTAPEKRLSLLLQRVDAITAQMSELRGRRQLDAEALARIRMKLETAPQLDIEIGGAWKDDEALALAGELRTLFEGAGFKPRKLAEYIPPQHLPTGVSIYSSHVLDGVLSEAIAQIFTELEQDSIQWLEDDVTSPDKQLGTGPDLKIIVNRK